VADASMADTGQTDARDDGTPYDDPPAVWRLRSRGCWTEAAELLAAAGATDPDTALRRATLLIERCMCTADGWADAEDALRTAEALARTDDERGRAACERGYLAYTATVLGARDRADEAHSALGRAAALLPPGVRDRALLDFRRGLIAENLSASPAGARLAYRRAHACATGHGDRLLASFTWRHLAGLALREGDLAEARHGFTESLRIQEELGYLIGMPPSLLSLAEVETEPESTRLRVEASRLFRLLGGLPVWLAEVLAE
jgi:tetratricopeptide (TPR) repeat protein